MSLHCHFRRERLVLSAMAAGALMFASPGVAQERTAGPARGNNGTSFAPQPNETTAGDLNELLRVPVSGLVPGAIAVRPDVKIPEGGAAAAQRGMKAFNAFNCVGCHMGNGGGGMGPALSQRAFTYGSEPANIYLTIVQGRPNGMPAWGSVLPNEIVWDLVAYVRSISNAPESKEWGTTVSPTSPSIEQVPAEFQSTATPWDNVQKVSHGQKP
jgi:cytochrome c oxidase cbb3-type subunit 3